jgi:mannose-6-phosphate isomerase
LWFQRTHKHAPIPALLLKFLFTSEPLSIQVHPDDEFARSIGLPNGKTEA